MLDLTYFVNINVNDPIKKHKEKTFTTETTLIGVSCLTTCVSRGSLSPAQLFLTEGPCYSAASVVQSHCLSGRDLWPHDYSETQKNDKKTQRYRLFKPVTFHTYIEPDLTNL